jgi:hypothetical protein
MVKLSSYPFSLHRQDTISGIKADVTSRNVFYSLQQSSDKISFVSFPYTDCSGWIGSVIVSLLGALGTSFIMGKVRTSLILPDC